jgi:hypothetical protein
MNKVLSTAVVVAGLAILLRGTAGWAGPPNPTQSDNNNNTAGGTNALINNTGGFGNTAFGAAALFATGLNTTTADENTAIGDLALYNDTTGSDNTAIGFHALLGTFSNYNVAVGAYALSNNHDGTANTATGADALLNNTSGNYNTASGFQALASSTSGASGSYNTATGVNTLYSNGTGSNNTASGAFALDINTSGAYNTALGYQALYNSTGSRNLALGYNAGYKLTSGDKNIYVGNSGVASESNTMRLGQVVNQTKTFIAGIYGVALSSGSPKPVYINSSGQVGLLASSARYKRDIQDMREHSQGLYSLRPVTFRYKQDRQGQQQYGLIAEEVAKVNPELVTKGADGKVESVQYHELIPMLLNEVQHQQQRLETQSQELAELKAQNAALVERLGRLEAATLRTATAATH